MCLSTIPFRSEVRILRIRQTNQIFWQVLFPGPGRVAGVRRAPSPFFIAIGWEEKTITSQHGKSWRFHESLGPRISFGISQTPWLITSETDTAKGD